MNIVAHIAGMNQVMDFDTGVQMTYLILRLPNGKVCQASIEDTDAQEIVQFFIESGGTSSRGAAPPPPPISPSAAPAAKEVAPEGFATDDGGSLVFGGSDPPPPAVATQANGIPSRFVGKDDMGYPILEFPNGTPSQSVPASQGGDEDGVPSL